MSRITDLVGLALGARRIVKAAGKVYGEAISERLHGFSVPSGFSIQGGTMEHSVNSTVSSDAHQKGDYAVQEKVAENSTTARESLNNPEAPPDSSPTATLLEKNAADRRKDSFGQTASSTEYIEPSPTPVLQSSRVPSSRIERMFHYGGLALGVGAGIAGEAVKRATGISTAGSSILLTDGNIQRIVKRLSRMRGAALKLGQMLSIQDNKMLPPELENVFLQVQNSANYMPDSQLQKMMRHELGDDWRDKFLEFELIPIAAASIGQVHKAKLHDGTVVAVKVQYPGVAKSIDSDLANLKTLILFSNFLPKGLYLDNTIKVAQRELAWECDYIREAEAMKRFSDLIRDDPYFKVPNVYPELSTKSVLTTEFVPGFSLAKLDKYPQHVRDKVATKILELSLRETFEFRFMQTDPNWSNFLFDPAGQTVQLLDFGAAREFDEKFVKAYISVIKAAVDGDCEGCLKWSQELGFLTGMESEAMKSAHVNSILSLAEPFVHIGLFDFGKQDITSRVRSEIPVMLRERLKPPPDETYSLHRKLSGSFLLCTKLRARVACHDMFHRIYNDYWKRI